jgi:ABC-type lipoprotein export system ATPase subunit
MSLKINNLSFIYSKEIFSYSDYCFKKGITIISAPSGRGKSTLFSLLIRAIKPHTGIISWNYVNILEYSKLYYLDSIVSIVFQGGNISYYFTLCQYIELLALNREKQTKELAEFYLEALAIRYLLNVNIMNCSGGEKYKIALFLALIKDTPLLLLDEPTAHLDKNNSINLFSLLKNITDKIILIITHDQLFFENMIDCNYYYL